MLSTAVECGIYDQTEVCGPTAPHSNQQPQIHLRPDRGLWPHSPTLKPTTSDTSTTRQRFVAPQPHTQTNNLRYIYDQTEVCGPTAPHSNQQPQIHLRPDRGLWPHSPTLKPTTSDTSTTRQRFVAPQPHTQTNNLRYIYDQTEVCGPTAPHSNQQPQIHLRPDRGLWPHSPTLKPTTSDTSTTRQRFVAPQPHTQTNNLRYICRYVTSNQNRVCTL